MVSLDRQRSNPGNERQVLNGELLASVSQRLADLGQLEPDWDSYGGHPPTRVALEQAADFFAQVVEQLGQMDRERVRPALISPLPSGGIEMEWRNAERLIAIDVGPDGQWGYLGKTGSGRSAQYEEGENVARDTLFPLLAEVLLPRPSS